MFYSFQDKEFKKFVFDPNTGEIEIENFGSETSQVVTAAIQAALSKAGVK